MIRDNNISGIILAGGKSSRMGQDKGLMPYKGRLFIEHSIEALTPLVSEIMIVSDNKVYDKFNLIRVKDIIPNSGPLAGIYTGLFHSKTENNIVLSCDVPMINKAVLMKLITAIEPSFDIIQVMSKDKTMPLIALYKKRCLEPCLRLLNTGERRLKVFVEQQNTKTIMLEKELEKYVVNINTKHDLNVLKNEIDN